jgi:hypothetical protein
MPDLSPLHIDSKSEIIQVRGIRSHIRIRPKSTSFDPLTKALFLEFPKNDFTTHECHSEAIAKTGTNRAEPNLRTRAEFGKQ